MKFSENCFTLWKFDFEIRDLPQYLFGPEETDGEALSHSVTNFISTF